jgi:hypothetical protein
MSSNSDRSFTVNPPESAPESAIAPSDNRQPMQIYRPEPSPLPGNRPIADNTADDTDELLGYLD